MSGGVDSALAAALLTERGEDVVGVWMRLTPAGTSGDAPRCCGTDEAGEDARRAAAHLGIPFYALDYAEVFGREVVDRFVGSYAAGETPNPCVACNGYVKFEALLGDVVRKFGASRLATGHYARVATDSSGRRRLLRGRDPQKDQSYALYMLGQRELSDPPRGYHGLQKLPVDLTFNLGFRIDTNAGGFVFAFSNVIGFVPVAGGTNP